MCCFIVAEKGLIQMKYLRYKYVFGCSVAKMSKINIFTSIRVRKQKAQQNKSVDWLMRCVRKCVRYLNQLN